MVEEVEGFQAELQPQGLPDRQILEHGRVEFHETWTAHGAWYRGPDFQR